MKLWKKVSLLCSLVLVLIVGASTVLLIGQARDKILNLTYQNAEQKQQALVRSFNNMLQYYHEEQDSEAATRSLMKYCFTQYADSEAVLMLSGETIYSSLSLDPSEYLTMEGSDTPQRYTGAVNGRQLLIVGGDARLPYTFTHNLEGLSCIVYIVQDITPVYDQIRTLTLQFVVIGAVCIGLGLLLIALLVRRSLRPLQKLQSAASHIAEGNYAERVAVTSSDEVGALAQDFNVMAASVEQHIEELTETAERQRLFIGGVTHEFKTPLTALLLNADSLKTPIWTRRSAAPPSRGSSTRPAGWNGWCKSSSSLLRWIKSRSCSRFLSRSCWIACGRAPRIRWLREGSPWKRIAAWNPWSWTPI